MSLVAHESMPPPEEKRCIVIVKDHLKTTSNRMSLVLLPSTSCKDLYKKISKKFHYVCGTFDVVLTKSNLISPCSIDDKDEKDLRHVGFSVSNKNYVEIRERPGVAVEMLHPSTICEADESPSSTIPEPPPLLPSNQILGSTASQRRMAVSSNDKEVDGVPHNNVSECTNEMVSLKMLKLVGLVNQAMTCYLNSLIQTLFMTPEFRNALYKWECDSPKETSTSIPYQLQHLFLLLQTSEKSVETTGLTRSFGWDSSEAWQQHDVQELCRVMFDALEKKFEGTDQADLIKCLYEGAMKDYVQCCECGHESARDDTFLDIPITIRPFGSTKTYKSVMEGLNAFVEPETLDESNQYYCEKCDKKCDAKKGLKFTRFPYLLTLQLKRFDFDYSTMNRVKLNDCMSFPQILNLNSFIVNKETKLDDLVNGEEDIPDLISPGSADEDSSSHDSGHDLEQASSLTNSESQERFQTNPRSSSEEEEGSSVDEGIDIEPQSSSHKRRKNSSTWWMNDEADEIARYLKEGPYVYELFSIMVHSGSAAGGHYYAYIKSFENNRWYSFNDQIVSPITVLDIEKTYGGSPYTRSSSSYYSSYSSSTNAYMLMYRQINSSKNANFVSANELPPHILRLLEQEREAEKVRRMKIEQEKNMCSIRVYCRHHSLRTHLVRAYVDETFDFHKDTMLADAVKQAHVTLKLDPNVVPPEQCRLVKYDHINDVLDRSFDLDTEDVKYPLSYLLGGQRNTYLFDLLLETREANETFRRYERGGVTVKVFVADHQKMCFHSPFILRVTESQTVQQLKTAISEKLECNPEHLLVAYEKYSGECQLLQTLKHTLKDVGFFRSAKVFVDIMSLEEYAIISNTQVRLNIEFEGTYLWNVVDRMANVINVNISLPPAETSEDHHTSNTSYSTVGANEKCATENTSSTSSSDEGVGSLGAGSGNGDSSSPRTVDPVSDHHFTPIQEDGLKLREIEPTPSEVKGFWKIPEMAETDDVPPLVEDNAEHGSGRKRNNSYEENILQQQLVTDFNGELKERLEGFVSGISPTSSLRCEDSNSSHSGQNSLITDMDFEGDDSKVSEAVEDVSTEDNSQQASKPLQSETSSLSNSCSTLDSTDTLCNPSDTSNNFQDLNSVASVRSAEISSQYGDLFLGAESKLVFNDETNTEIRSGAFRPVLNRSCPGHVSCSAIQDSQAQSDYTKALLHADESAATDGKGEFIQPKPIVLNAAGTGDPSDSNVDAKKTLVSGQCDKHVSASDSGRSGSYTENNSGLDQKSDVTESNTAAQSRKPLVTFSSCADAISTPSGHLSSQTSNTATSSDHPQPESFALDDPNPTDRSSDPDSGEGMERLQPLLTEEKPSPSVATRSNLMDNESQNRTVQGPENNRERTVSVSSVTSDGWGVSNEIAQKHSFFRILGTSQSTSTHASENGEQLTSTVIHVEIDKRMSLLGLKRHLAQILSTPTRRFCVYRLYTVGQEVEVTAPTDDFRLANDGANFIVRFGRALLKDEYRCKLFQLALDEEEPIKPFMNWIVQRGACIAETKKLLVNDLLEQCDLDCDPDRIRFRKKSWRSPGQVFLDDDVFGTDVTLYGSLEFYVEFLKHPEPKTKRGDLLLLCRRWYPKELRFSDFHELVLHEEEGSVSYLGYSIDQLRRTLSKLSEIPEENVVVAKGRGMFPYRMSVLSADMELDWVPNSDRIGTIHLSEDGTVVFYKDNRDVLKECTKEEREEIEKKENKSDTTIGNSGSTTASNVSTPTRPSYRREKALKIYTVDTAPTIKNREVTTEL